MPTDPLAPTDPFSRDDILSMTHQPEVPNPTIDEANRRLKLTGQNLYDSWVAPAKRLGEAATSGTLDVTDPATAGDALGLVSGVTGARAPFAKAGTVGSAGGKPPRYLVTSPEGKKYILSPSPEADVLPRNPGRAYDPNRPINPETLAEMREMQEEMGAPDMGGRPIHPDVLKAMREEQEE